MQRVYVLEQSFTNAAEAVWPDVVSDVSAWLDDLDGLRCQAAGEELLLYGISEPMLGAARAVLRAHCGDDLQFGPVRVRYAGFPLREPVMDLFVNVAASFGEAIRRELRRRRARILFTTVGETSWLIRAQASMARLLGFPAALRSLAGDRADHWITFDHWWPLGSPATISHNSNISTRNGHEIDQA